MVQPSLSTTSRIESTRPIQVLVVDDHPIVRHGLKQLVESDPGLRVCGEAASINEACDYLDAQRPDIVLVDLSLPDGDGMNLVRHIATNWVGVRVIVVSTCNAWTYGPIALSAGAMGYVDKHEAVDQIIEAIRCVAGGKQFFCRGSETNATHWFG